MNKFIKVIILPISLLLHSCGIYNYYKITKVKDSSYTIGASSLQVIPFEMINNRIVVPVFIQGSTYKFLFDTGASLILDSEVLDEIEYENIAKIKVTDANEKRESLKYVKLSEIKFTEALFRDQGAIVMDLSDPIRNSCINISGIFGASVMKDLIWQINFEKNTIKVSDNIEDLNLDSSSFKIPFDTNPSHSPIIEVNIDGYGEEVLIDTGAGSTFCLPKGSIDMDSVNGAVKAFGILGGVFGERIDTLYYLPKNISLDISGEHTWQGVIEIRKSMEQGIIGLGFLKDYLVTVDFYNQNLYLKRVNFNYLNLSKYGFNFKKSGSNVIVSKVLQNSEAYKAGIRVGNIIQEIDGYSFEGMTEVEICHFIEKDYLNSVGSSIRIKLNEVEKYISVEKQYFDEK